ncbi:hypothetical protein FGO68_gene17277 [Halteria grandinella]|uniref:Uncharacterized protein n=1 Tax=Halteria grandinella TaxID=5974 RepID=A0A8J8NLJ4_HALGN|nr:hypothetical protein FGO68_gene17277 [Halteria grandinella]
MQHRTKNNQHQQKVAQVEIFQSTFHKCIHKSRFSLSLTQNFSPMWNLQYLIILESCSQLRLNINKFKDGDFSISEEWKTENALRTLADLRGLKVYQYKEIETSKQKKNYQLTIGLKGMAARTLRLQINGARSDSVFDIYSSL